MLVAGTEPIATCSAYLQPHCFIINYFFYILLKNCAAYEECIVYIIYCCVDFIQHFIWMHFFFFISITSYMYQPINCGCGHSPSFTHTLNWTWGHVVSCVSWTVVYVFCN